MESKPLEVCRPPNHKPSTQRTTQNNSATTTHGGYLKMIPSIPYDNESGCKHGSGLHPNTLDFKTCHSYFIKKTLVQQKTWTFASLKYLKWQQLLSNKDTSTSWCVLVWIHATVDRKNPVIQWFNAWNQETDTLEIQHTKHVAFNERNVQLQICFQVFVSGIHLIIFAEGGGNVQVNPEGSKFTEMSTWSWLLVQFHDPTT